MANKKYPKAGDIEQGASFRDSDIEKWAGSLSKILEDMPQYMCRPGHSGRISRIPENIREIDPKAYEPCFLSVGPYHHGKPALKPTETTKRLVLKAVLQAKPELRLENYLNELKSIELEVRSFYSDIQMGSQNFLFMLLVDSIYLLSLFCGMPENKKKNLEDEVINEMDEEMKAGNYKGSMLILKEDELMRVAVGLVDTPRILSAPFLHDLFLLENQLPLFVLEKIYGLAYNGSEARLICIIKDTIGSILVDYAKSDGEMVISSTKEVHHLLHICHIFFQPCLQMKFTTCQLPESNEMFRLGSAVQLYEGGVRFVPRISSSQQSLLDITFSSSGVLVMPCLFVDDNTNSLLRNHITLEQMKYPTLGLNVSAYAILLLHLVTTPEDARLLRRKGIIQHHLASDKEMVYLVNKLSVGLSFDYTEDNYSLKPVFQELKRYSDRRVPRWRAWLKHRYFNNSWTLIALVSAFIFLFLSVVQTFFTVYSYYIPCVYCHS